MKSIRYLSLLVVPLFLAACTVEEDRGTEDQLVTKDVNTPKPRKTPIAGGSGSGNGQVDNTFSNVKPSAEKEDSKDGEMSEYEKQSLESQKRHQEMLEKQMAQEQARHESITSMEKEGLKLQRMTAYGIFALMGQWMQSMEAMGLGNRPGIPEDCEVGAVGTTGTSNEWSRFMSHLERQIQQDLGEDESADFRSNSGEGNSVPAPAPTGEQVQAGGTDADVQGASQGANNSSDTVSTPNANAGAGDNASNSSSDTGNAQTLLGPVQLPGDRVPDADGWLGIPYELPNRSAAAAPAADNESETTDSNS